MALLGLIPDPPKSGVTLKLTAEEAKKEAAGRALIMIGSTIGMFGSALVLLNNPIVKQQSQGVWEGLPQPLRENKPLLFIGIGMTAAAVITYAMRSSTTKYWDK